jgi:hypothetical protein
MTKEADASATRRDSLERLNLAIIDFSSWTNAASQPINPRSVVGMRESRLEFFAVYLVFWILVALP